MRHPLVEGDDATTTSGFQRAVLAADSGNGISCPLPYTKWQYPNTDLTFNTFRRPRGEWTLVDAQTHVGDDGVGLTVSHLFDESLALFGLVTQSLMVRPRTLS